MFTDASRRIVAAAAAAATPAAPAATSISPINGGIQANSTNANFDIFGIDGTGSSGLRFWTPASTNGPVGLTDDRTATPRLNACNVGSVSTGSGWTISLTPITATQNTATVQLPGGGSGSDGAAVTLGATALTGTYTDGATSLVINPTRAPDFPFTSTFCASGTGTFTAVYTLSLGVTVT